MGETHKLQFSGESPQTIRTNCCTVSAALRRPVRYRSSNEPGGFGQWVSQRRPCEFAVGLAHQTVI